MQSDRSPVLLVIIQALLATMVLTSLLSLMHAFVGGSRSDADFARLEGYQFFGVGLSLGGLLWSLAYFSRNGSLLAGVRGAVSHMPGWMIFGVIVLNSLALVGELSYLLLADAGDLLDEWINHVALICLASSSIAFAFLFAVAHASNGGSPFKRERW